MVNAFECVDVEVVKEQLNGTLVVFEVVKFAVRFVVIEVVPHLGDFVSEAERVSHLAEAVESGTKGDVAFSGLLHGVGGGLSELFLFRAFYGNAGGASYAFAVIVPDSIPYVSALFETSHNGS